MKGANITGGCVVVILGLGMVRLMMVVLVVVEELMTMVEVLRKDERKG